MFDSLSCMQKESRKKIGLTKGEKNLFQGPNTNSHFFKKKRGVARRWTTFVKKTDIISRPRPPRDPGPKNIKKRFLFYF